MVNSNGSKRSRTDEKDDMGIIGDVRLGMTTANESTRTVEDMAQRGGLVSITLRRDVNGEGMPLLT